jgi:hypothetical protein
MATSGDFKLAMDRRLGPHSLQQGFRDRLRVASDGHRYFASGSLHSEAMAR